MSIGAVVYVEFADLTRDEASRKLRLIEARLAEVAPGAKVEIQGIVGKTEPTDMYTIDGLKRVHHAQLQVRFKPREPKPERPRVSAYQPPLTDANPFGDDTPASPVSMFPPAGVFDRQVITWSAANRQIMIGKRRAVFSPQEWQLLELYRDRWLAGDHGWVDVDDVFPVVFPTSRVGSRGDQSTRIAVLAGHVRAKLERAFVGLDNIPAFIELKHHKGRRWSVDETLWVVLDG